MIFLFFGNLCTRFLKSCKYNIISNSLPLFRLCFLHSFTSFWGIKSTAPPTGGMTPSRPGPELRQSAAKAKGYKPFAFASSHISSL